MELYNEELYIYQNIVWNMQEGVFVLDMKGQFILMNPAGCNILHISNQLPVKFAALFNDPRNDEFSQLILNAIYEKKMSHNALVDYFSNDIKKKLFVNTSYLNMNNKDIGILTVMNDVTELMNLYR